jgi:hypothetical protein
MDSEPSNGAGASQGRSYWMLVGAVPRPSRCENCGAGGSRHWRRPGIAVTLFVNTVIDLEQDIQLYAELAGYRIDFRAPLLARNV